MNKLAVDGGTPIRTEPFPKWPIFGELEEQMILDVIRSGKWGGTGKVSSDQYTARLPEMERKFADLQDAKYGVSVVNGTVAITVALQAAGVKSGDEVIMPPYTFIATASAALAYGAIPVFVDIEEDTLLIDPLKVEQAITTKTKAIIAVHIAGAPANMTRLTEIAKKHNLMLIEDAAQAVGAQWEGKGVGAIGDIGTFSFQSTKNLNSGEGGMILTNDERLWENAWSGCNVGRIPNGAWYQHERLGQNYRMTELQAAIVVAQMSRLSEQMNVREKNARLLNEFLKQNDGIRLIKEDSRITRHARHLYMFRIEPERVNQIVKKDLIEKVNAEGIPLLSGYIPLNQNKAILDSIREWTGKERFDSCPVCERLSEKEVLWLSQDILLADEKAMHDIANALKKVTDSLLSIR
jgi:dTDP-4-amino-4,6-dideoxygalactose transaminase